MPSVTNISSDDLNMPSVGGLSLKAGETAEVDEFVASELFGHPLLHVDGWEPDNPQPAPPALPVTEENAQ